MPNTGSDRGADTPAGVAPDAGGPSATPHDDGTRELTSRIRAGDAAAFERLYRERFDAMFAEAKRATGRDESFCLDVVQDVMMKVIHAIPALDTEAALRAWLRRVTLTTARDLLRSEARRSARERISTRSESATTRDARNDSETLRALESAIAELDAAASTLVTSRYRFGWTLERIAARMGIGTGAADGRLSRLILRLRTAVSQRTGGDEGGTR